MKATKLQTVLGDHQDAVVATDRVRALLPAADAEIGFVAGRIAEHELPPHRGPRRMAGRLGRVDAAAKALHADPAGPPRRGPPTCRTARGRDRRRRPPKLTCPAERARHLRP